MREASLSQDAKATIEDGERLRPFVQARAPMSMPLLAVAPIFSIGGSTHQQAGLARAGTHQQLLTQDVVSPF